TSAILTTSYKLPFEIAFITAGLLAGFASLTLVPITRLRGVYLGVATLGFSIIVHLIFLNEEWLTGGSFGLLNIPPPSLGPWILKSETATYLLCLAVLVAAFITLHRLLPRRFCRALQAIIVAQHAQAVLMSPTTRARPLSSPPSSPDLLAPSLPIMRIT